MGWCQNCQAIRFEESLREKEPKKLWGEIYPCSTFAVLQPSWEALQESADNGCPLCSKFWVALSRDGRWVFEKPRPEDHDGAQGGTNQECNDEAPPVVLLCYHMENDNNWLFNGVVFIVCGNNESVYRPKLPVPGDLIELFARSYASTPMYGGLQNDVARQADDSTGSDVNLRLAKLWLQDCLHSHEQCTRGSVLHAPPVLPSRVVDVADPENCFLFESYGQRDDYLTLSYCWGEGERLLTTRQRYATFQRRLPINDQMPLTFRETFIVTRALGYRYIWIDALCIIQDEPQDLNRELAKMGNIYQNSTVTVFASKGPNTNSGLFASRNGAFYKPCNAMIQRIEGNEHRKTEVAFVSRNYSHGDPLSGRGWVLQEQVLAKRHLIFTPREIQWTCKVRKLSEARPHKARDYGPDGPKDYESVMRDPLNLMHLLVTDPPLFTRMTETSEDLGNHFNAWYHVVVRYSARNLTFQSDKLSAIAGIAQLMQSNSGYKYGAGLWKEDFPVALCWKIARSLADDNNVPAEPDELSDHLEKEYIAPSWSWASVQNRGVDYPVYYYRSEKVSKECVQVLDWEFTYPAGGVVPFGQVTSGVLTLKGHLRKALLIPPPPRTRRSVWGARILWHAYVLNAHTTSIVGEAALDTLDIYKTLHKKYQDLPQEEYGPDYPSNLVSRALPVSCLTTYVVDDDDDEDDDKHQRIFALLLVPHDISKQQYRRVGLLHNRVPAPHTDGSNPSIVGSSDRDEDRQIVHIV